MTTTQAGPRRRHRRRLVLLCVVGGLAAALVIAWVVAARVFDSPEPSSFYEPSDPLPSGPPGTVIRVEDIASDAPGMRVQRVLYTSTDPDDRPIAVSGVVVTPTSEPPRDGWPVLAWAHGTTGIRPPCAPSLEDDGGVGRIPELREIVDAGTVVVATDYPGLGTPGTHPYLVGESEGRAVLDSVRAARSVASSTVETAAVYGHSQGGHAVLYSAEIAPSYAPELELVGTAAMAPPTDLGVLVDRDTDEPLGIILTSLAVRSWATLYPERVQEDDLVSAAARPFVEGIADRCIGTIGDGSRQALVELPEVVALEADFLSADPATTPGWSQLLQQNSATATTIRTPLLVAQGLADELVRPDVTERFVRDQCADGAAIDLRTYPGVGHFQVRTVAASTVATWLLERLDGTPPPSGCRASQDPP